MLSIESVHTVSIEGVECVTLQEFARLTHRSVTTIRRLIDSGNQYRCMQVIRAMGKPLVPISELKNFPFTVQGREQRGAFHLRLDTKENKLVLVEAYGYCASDEYLFCDNKCLDCKFYKRLTNDRVPVKDNTVCSPNGSVQ